jgi:hypothetical protein
MTLVWTHLHCAALAQPKRRAETRRVFADPREKGRLSKVRNGAEAVGLFTLQ